jgi:hypothetical protein
MRRFAGRWSRWVVAGGAAYSVVLVHPAEWEAKMGSIAEREHRGIEAANALGDTPLYPRGLCGVVRTELTTLGPATRRGYSRHPPATAHRPPASP